MQDIKLAEVSQRVSKPFHNRPLLSKGPSSSELWVIHDRGAVKSLPQCPQNRT